MLEFMLWLAATGAASIGGFVGTRRFVRERLRFVDAAHRRSTPWIAGGVALAAATPVVWVLPVVGAGTAMLVGAAVGLGVQKGSRDTRGSGHEVMVV